MIIIIILLTIPYIILITKKNLHILQQNFYNENNRYIKWGLKNLTTILRIPDIIILSFMLLNFLSNIKYLYLINIIYIFYYFYLRNINKNAQVKIPLKVTSRVKRMIVTISIIYIIPIILTIINIKLIFIYNLFILFNFIIVYLANIINKPIESYVFHYYKSMALKKLRSMNNLEVIGITGSYGKTSTKNILNDILSVKYLSLPTPKNYNTQYGLIMTINNNLDKFDEYFICEMGAFKRGRIKLLCDLVKPKYGIITTIGDAHLETFKTKENIQKGKFELIESLPSDGLGILNMDDEYQVNYKLTNKVKILWISTKNKEADYYAHDIKIDSKGMNFLVYFKDIKKDVLFNTKLLGIPNVYNILAGIALSYTLGLSVDELVRGVKNIKTIPHRLELKKMGNLNIIDDAYNSNPVGAKMALDALSLMPGARVVVTPGMIELGINEDKLNYEFGENISAVADYVILVGKKQTSAILKGLKKHNFNEDRIIIINDVKEAFNIVNELKIKKDIYMLLENDLPDIYNEGDKR